MKYLVKNKHWRLTEDYNCDKLLYLLIDRPTEINSLNEILWKNNEKECHREYDLPAVVWDSGNISWWKNNQFHREDYKPARIWSSGHREYYFHNNKQI